MLFLALMAVSGNAAVLIGTIKTSSTETIPEINDLIAAYNSDFNAALPLVASLLDKIEGQDAADFTQANLNLSDFNFYHRSGSGAISVNVFDATVQFTPSSLGPAAGFDTLDNRVFGFEQLSGPAFDYYVAKDGSLGWSLWLHTSGISPAYIDAGIGDSSITGSGFTRGNTNDNTLAFDPVARGVSHISFYLAETTLTAVPELSSALSFAAVVAALGLLRCRSVLGLAS